MAGLVDEWLGSKLLEYSQEHGTRLGEEMSGQRVQVERWLTTGSPEFATVCDRKHRVLCRFSDESVANFYGVFKKRPNALRRAIIRLETFKPFFVQRSDGGGRELALDVLAFDLHILPGPDEPMYYAHLPEITRTSHPELRSYITRLLTSHPLPGITRPPSPPPSPPRSASILHAHLPSPSPQPPAPPPSQYPPEIMTSHVVKVGDRRWQIRYLPGEAPVMPSGVYPMPKNFPPDVQRDIDAKLAKHHRALARIVAEKKAMAAEDDKAREVQALNEETPCKATVLPPFVPFPVDNAHHQGYVAPVKKFVRRPLANPPKRPSPLLPSSSDAESSQGNNNNDDDDDDDDWCEDEGLESAAVEKNGPLPTTVAPIQSSPQTQAPVSSSQTETHSSQSQTLPERSSHLSRQVGVITSAASNLSPRATTALQPSGGSKVLVPDSDPERDSQSQSQEMLPPPPPPPRRTVSRVDPSPPIQLSDGGLPLPTPAQRQPRVLSSTPLHESSSQPPPFKKRKAGGSSSSKSVSASTDTTRDMWAMPSFQMDSEDENVDADEEVEEEVSRVASFSVEPQEDGARYRSPSWPASEPESQAPILSFPFFSPAQLQPSSSVKTDPSSSSMPQPTLSPSIRLSTSRTLKKRVRSPNISDDPEPEPKPAVLEPPPLAVMAPSEPLPPMLDIVAEGKKLRRQRSLARRKSRAGTTMSIEDVMEDEGIRPSKRRKFAEKPDGSNHGESTVIPPRQDVAMAKEPPPVATTSTLPLPLATPSSPPPRGALLPAAPAFSPPSPPPQPQAPASPGLQPFSHRAPQSRRDTTCPDLWSSDEDDYWTDLPVEGYLHLVSLLEDD